MRKRNAAQTNNKHPNATETASGGEHNCAASAQRLKPQTWGRANVLSPPRRSRKARTRGKPVTTFRFCPQNKTRELKNTNRLLENAKASRKTMRRPIQLQSKTRSRDNQRGHGHVQTTEGRTEQTTTPNCTMVSHKADATRMSGIRGKGQPLAL